MFIFNEEILFRQSVDFKLNSPRFAQQYDFEPLMFFFNIENVK